ncbi:hypothetical protein [Nocardia sp. CC201C]|uniref:hypothetical protein n=1 Tax=Nocardia sp. CC201C TaxID=3044575 RepID=UPI0024A7FA40|nr:hypothetical protein [Nocardia sp. CC201C]
MTAIKGRGSRRRQCIEACAVLAIVAALAFFGREQKSDHESTPTAAAPTTTSRVAYTGAPSTTVPTGHEDSTAELLSAAGVTEGLLVRLHLVAMETNYGIARDTAIERGILEGLAYVMVLFCRDIATGIETWESFIEQDMSTGATLQVAIKMNRFLRTEYCPAVRLGRPR